MEDTRQPRPFASSSQSQLVSLKHELENIFHGGMASLVESPVNGQGHVLYVRIFRDNNPIRDTIFVLSVHGNRCELRFSVVESIGNLGDAKLRLVEHIAQATHKAGLLFVYDERMPHGLSESERDKVKNLVPESYRKKMDGLGIDWRLAQ